MFYIENLARKFQSKCYVLSQILYLQVQRVSFLFVNFVTVLLFKFTIVVHDLYNILVCLIFQGFLMLLQYVTC